MPQQIFPSRRLKAVAGICLAFLLVVLALQLTIDHGRDQVARAAIERFPGDRIEALASLVACANCTIKERNSAVWALGQFGDRRALPVLKKHFTGHECQHGVNLCEYELGKAIKKIEGRWTIAASLRLE